MEHIVKSETAPTMAQARVTASVLVSMIVVLAALGMFAAAQAGSTASVVLAVVVALTAQGRLTRTGARTGARPRPRKGTAA